MPTIAGSNPYQEKAFNFELHHQRVDFASSGDKVTRGREDLASEDPVPSFGNSRAGREYMRLHGRGPSGAGVERGCRSGVLCHRQRCHCEGCEKLLQLVDFFIHVIFTDQDCAGLVEILRGVENCRRIHLDDHGLCD